MDQRPASVPPTVPTRPTRPTTPTTMTAVAHDRYGGPEVLEVREVPVPEPGPDEVRVRVAAAGLNPYDWHRHRGEPILPVRPSLGLRRPAAGSIPGADFAGTIDRVGSPVPGLAVGDRVFGEVAGNAVHGACAEYVVVPASRVTATPEGLDDVTAAAVPMGATTALEGLRRVGSLDGARVLVNGASGGVGHVAIQLARVLGAAEVVGVCGTARLDLVRDLGADDVVDHTVEDVTRSGRTFDVVFDTAGSHSVRSFCRVLAPDGTLVLVGGGRGRWMEPAGQILRAGLQMPVVRPRIVLVARVDCSGAVLAEVAEWIAQGRVRPVVDRTWPLRETAEAMRHLETGHVRGKVVVTT